MAEYVNITKKMVL